MQFLPFIVITVALLIWNIALNVLLLKKDGHLKPKPTVAPPKEEKKPVFYHGAGRSGGSSAVFGRGTKP